MKSPENIPSMMITGSFQLPGGASLLKPFSCIFMDLFFVKI